MILGRSSLTLIMCCECPKCLVGTQHGHSSHSSVTHISLLQGTVARAPDFVTVVPAPFPLSPEGLEEKGPQPRGQRCRVLRREGRCRRERQRQPDGGLLGLFLSFPCLKREAWPLCHGDSSPKMSSS